MRQIDADALYETLCHIWDRSDSEEFEQAVFESIANAPTIEVPQWIPCSERLPKPNRHDALNVDVYYLAQTEFGDMIVASYNESHEGTKWWEQMYSYRIFDDEIVAWMPLPKPYGEREGE